MKWLDLAAFATGTMLAAVYFYEDKLLLGVLWTLIAVIDGLMLVVRDNGL